MLVSGSWGHSVLQTPALVFFFFSVKTSLDFSCESSAQQTIHMKSQDLFSLKNKKKIKMSSAAVVIGALRVNCKDLFS